MLVHEAKKIEDTKKNTEEPKGFFQRLKNWQENNKKDEIKENVIEDVFLKKNAEGTYKTPSTQKVETMTNIILNAREKENEENSNFKPNVKFEEMYAKTFGAEVVKEKKEENLDYNQIQYADSKSINVFEENTKYNELPEYKIIGSAFENYIIIEIKNELYIIDIHLACEKIMYEKIKNIFYSQEEKDSQTLLVPDVINLSEKQANILKENLSLLEQTGFEVEEFGLNAIKLTEVPSICVELNTKKLFLEILDELDTVAINAKQEKEKKFIETISYKVAINVTKPSNNIEAEELIKKLLVLPNTFILNDKPISIKIKKEDIERKFSRR